MTASHIFLALALAIICIEGPAFSAPALPEFDFTRSATGWAPAHDVKPLEASPDGLAVTITGGDPYIIGPAADYPADVPLWALIRLKPEVGGGGQVFYYRDSPSESASAGFYAKGGQWQTVRIALPPLGAGFRIRIDPPGDRGRVVIASLAFQLRPSLKEPAWNRPRQPDLAEAFSVRAGRLEIKHSRRSFGAFAVSVGAQQMAIGWSGAQIGYALDGSAHWLDLSRARVTASESGVQADALDDAGARWTLRQTFRPLPDTASGSAIEVSTSVAVDKDRAVTFLPMLVLFAGPGSFGETKGQALFAGLEYLDKDEPTSSEADIRGPQANRRVPDGIKITFPLMAVQSGGRYIGLIWEGRPDLSAVFDSPDRTFASGGHALAVMFPGSDSSVRQEGSLLPYEGVTLQAGRPVTLRAMIIGGSGLSVVPAVRQFVERRPPPALKAPLDLQGYLRLAAAGWLDSRIREGALVRHAYWPGFGLARASDAAASMLWLASQTSDSALAARLRDTARQVIGAVPPEQYLSARISHVPAAAPPLLFGHVQEAARRAEESASSILERFDSRGRIVYKPAAGGLDYSETHFAPDANGLTAASVVALLDSAAFSGSPRLIASAVEKLRGLDRFLNTVPRGAQTWEIPLHTPDILASAHLVKAYMLGYELTGEPEFLEKAKHWAWTGVPFIYLTPPVDAPVGLYSTIPVLGATAWVGSWFGRPVQWCGLVYADALVALMRHDADPFWKRLTDGILASGIQQTFPPQDAERQGLLPDFYLLRPQVSDGPAINPATLQVNIAHLYARPRMADFRSLRTAGLLVHAPGEIAGISQKADEVSFYMRGWAADPYYVLISGFKKQPMVTVNGKSVVLTGESSYDGKSGRLVLKVSGQPRIRIRQP